jgi:peptidoglycan/LPS O-acetylase OafA/YrhL
MFFGFVGWVASTHLAHPGCGIDCYVSAPQGPLEYIAHNFFLLIRQTQISGTPHGVPAPFLWDGSLWTLFYEFIAYLLLAGVAALGLLRRGVVAALAIVMWTLAFLHSFTPGVFGHHIINPFSPSIYLSDVNFVFLKFITLTSIFLGGSLLYFYRDRVVDSGRLALACTAVFAAALWSPVGGQETFFSVTTADLLAPLLAYPLLWLGIHLPLHKVGAKNDYSYGVYIYAFPVQQLLATWKFQRFGYVPFALLGIVATFPFAIASWWLVERHALRLKGLDFGALLRGRKPRDCLVEPFTVSPTEAPTSTVPEDAS